MKIKRNRKMKNLNLIVPLLKKTHYGKNHTRSSKPKKKTIEKSFEAVASKIKVTVAKTSGEILKLKKRKRDLKIEVPVFKKNKLSAK